MKINKNFFQKSVKLFFVMTINNSEGKKGNILYKMFPFLL